MEAKTIGKFITALRKANGMTQKDLAEKLNVSDKSVSRWERDEGAPDLSLIPVIAEIFDVTCDELLRGERKSPAEREAAKDAATDAVTDSEANTTTKEEFSAKSEKQLKRLLKVAFSQFKNRTCIALGLSVLGVIVALICNLAFLKAILGGLLGIIFYAAGIICQFIFHNRTALSVEDSGIDEESLAEFKHNTIRLTEKSIGFTVVCLGFTFPLFLVNNAYLGLDIVSLLDMGLVGIIIALILYVVILFFFNASLVEKGAYPLDAKNTAIFRHNHKLAGRCAIVLAVLIFITYSVQQWASDPYRLRKGTVYEDYESFVAYMEQDIQRTYHFNGNNMYVTEQVPNRTVYYDEYGNETTEKEALRRTLLDKNGEVVCEFIHRNGDVDSYESTPGDGTALPVTVYTYEDWFYATSSSRATKVFFIPLYLLELTAVVWFYRKKRM